MLQKLHAQTFHNFFLDNKSKMEPWNKNLEKQTKQNKHHRSDIEEFTFGSKH